MVPSLYSFSLQYHSPYFTDSRCRFTQPLRRLREEPTQAEEARPITQLLLHGRQMSRYVATHTQSYITHDSTLGCFAITTVFSHAHTVVLCGSCSSILCQPTGGRARLTEGVHLPFSFTSLSLIFIDAGCSFRRKN